MKPGLLVVNFGGPQDDAQLEPFLAELLGDVLPGPLKLFARRFATARARKVRDTYREIGFSPLVPDTLAQMQGLLDRLGPDAPPARAGMMFTDPFIRDAVGELLAEGCDRLVVVGLFPHWSFATSGSAYDMVHKALVHHGRAELPVHYARAFFDHPAYCEAVAETIGATREVMDGEGPIHLLFSAHGIPVSFVRRGDPYPEHVRESVRRITETLDWPDPWHLAWQSRLGPVRWLDPDTRDTIRRLGAEGVQRLLLVPVSFVGEHIETLDEMDRELKELAHEQGIPHVGRAPALGQTPAFLDALADVAQDALSRFGETRCSRCLIPVPGTHRREGTCKNCGFQRPSFLTEGVGGVS